MAMLSRTRELDVRRTEKGRIRVLLHPSRPTAGADVDGLRRVSVASWGTPSTERPFLPPTDSQKKWRITDSTGRKKRVTSGLSGTYSGTWFLRLRHTRYRE
jgi:hypothetical protein